jgi:polysaccharide pyruvyl transferase CsaB
MARLLLAGYFGCGNLGDDSILLGFLEGIKEDKHEVRALAGNPGMVMQRYGVQGVQRLDRGAVDQAIDQCDALVFPGGSIFQDTTSVRSVAYYSHLTRTAAKKGKKVVMLGQGVGPLKRFLGRKLAVSAFNSADAIAVRDRSSVQTLQDLGADVAPRATADMTFLLPKPNLNEQQQSYGVGNMKAVGLAPRPHGKDKNKKVIKLFGDLARLLLQNGYVPVLLEMDSMMDGPLIQQLEKDQGGKVPSVRNLTSPVQLQQRIARLDSVIAMRLHAGILSATVGVPPFMVSYDPKVAAFAGILDQERPPSIEEARPDRLFDAFQRFSKDRDKRAEKLEQKKQELAEQAFQNIEILRKSLG